MRESQEDQESAGLYKNEKLGFGIEREAPGCERFRVEGEERGEGQRY